MFRKIVAMLTILIVPLCSHAMTSTNFQILWDSVNIGGDETASSTNYQLHDTIGEMGTGSGVGNDNTLEAGYRVGAGNDYINLLVGSQDNSSEVAFTAFSNSLKTVTVASASGFAVGDFILVVENKGTSQRVALGAITNITGAVLTVSAWAGVPGSISSSPSGGDDVVYQLDGGSGVLLGTQSVSTVSTSVLGCQVSTNALNGYTVRVIADGNLRTTSTSITNVSDGSVTAGSEEYGAEVLGTNAVGTGSDFALSSTSTRVIQQSSTAASAERVLMIYKLGISSGTTAGSYTQQVNYVATANF
jgi:hypothetical protein